jgi:Leu/Phe-tRNA-protein transferase
MEAIPEGRGNKPVTWVSQEDARAYRKATETDISFSVEMLDRPF